MLKCLTGLVSLAFLANGAALTPVWVAVGGDGLALARVVVEKPSDCPSIVIDNEAPKPMLVRLPVPEGLSPACEFLLPPDARSAKVGTQKLALPRKDPKRVVILGDTGCRLKGERLQACNDPNEWPFERIAQEAAARHPDLVLHSGDLLYREEPCPAKGDVNCVGSPSGDTWAAWNADFFKPAHELLKAAPWLMTRGNHESCRRTWKGWFYYFDPRPMVETCVEHSAPYLAKLGSFQVLVLDSSEATETMEATQLAKFREQLKPYAATPAWLLLHHPVFGLKTAATAQAAPITEILKLAYEQAGLNSIGLIVSGHIHTFELLSFSNGWPPQMVAGESGTKLSLKADKNAGSRPIFGATLATSKFIHEFGFVEMRGSGERWSLRLRSKTGKKIASCELAGKNVMCN